MLEGGFRDLAYEHVACRLSPVARSNELSEGIYVNGKKSSQIKIR